MNTIIEGGCLCGGIRYNSLAEPAIVGVCHCSDCRKFSGSAFSFLVAIQKSALQLRGLLKTYSSFADSGHPISRSFCPECGSSIVEELSKSSRFHDYQCRDSRSSGFPVTHDRALLRKCAALDTTQWRATLRENAAVLGVWSRRVVTLI